MAEPGRIRSLNHASCAALPIAELERRIEAACVDIDPCFGSFCWHFATSYACESECAVLCAPFHGCTPYCDE